MITDAEERDEWLEQQRRARVLRIGEDLVE